MADQPTIKIENVFSVLIKEEPKYDENHEQKWLLVSQKEKKTPFCDCDEDLLVGICLKMEMYGSSAEARVDLNTDENIIINTESTDPWSSSNLPDGENNKGMSQALDLRLRINSTEDAAQQQLPIFNDANSKVEYKYTKVKEHWRKIKIPKAEARKKKLNRSVRNFL